MRARLLLFLALLGGCREAPPTQETRPLLPGGYLAHVDSGRSDPGHFRLDQVKDGIHVLTGPGGIAWRPADSVTSGAYRVGATFTVIAPPIGYREGYGVFVGGRNLEGATREYSYLLVRPKGEYTVRRRRGAVTDTLVAWTASRAVQRVINDGDDPVNTLSVEVGDGETRFLVNGTVVYRAPSAETRPYGLAGVRIDHRLDVRLTSWSLESPAAGESTDSTGA